jgi:hypothetical protein
MDEPGDAKKRRSRVLTTTTTSTSSSSSHPTLALPQKQPIISKAKSSTATITTALKSELHESNSMDITKHDDGGSVAKPTFKTLIPLGQPLSTLSTSSAITTTTTTTIGPVAKKTSSNIAVNTTASKSQRGRPPGKKSFALNAHASNINIRVLPDPVTVLPTTHNSEDGDNHSLPPIMIAPKNVIFVDDKVAVGVESIEYPTSDPMPQSHQLSSAISTTAGVNNHMDIDDVDEQLSSTIKTTADAIDSLVLLSTQENLGDGIAIAREAGGLPFDYVDFLLDDADTKGEDCRHVYEPMKTHIAHFIPGLNKLPCLTEEDDIHCLICNTLVVGDKYAKTIEVFNAVKCSFQDLCYVLCNKACVRRFELGNSPYSYGRKLLIQGAFSVYGEHVDPDVHGGIVPPRSRLRFYGGTLSNEEYVKIGQASRQLYEARYGNQPPHNMAGMSYYMDGDRRIQEETSHAVSSSRYYTTPLIHSIHKLNKAAPITISSSTTDDGLLQQQQHLTIPSIDANVFWDAVHNEWTTTSVLTSTSTRDTPHHIPPKSIFTNRDQV